MSDGSRLERCEEENKELKTRIGACEDRDDAVSDRVTRLEYWRNGNGARGAEQRLQDMEIGMSELSEKIPGLITAEDADKIARSAVRHVVEAARDKDRTTVSKVRAWAPYFATAGAVVAAIIAAVVK